jgi:hypothetical protein
MRQWIAAIGILALAACFDSTTEPAPLISGIYTATIPKLGDSLNVELSFGFDEVNGGYADGGVRAMIIPADSFRAPRFFKQGHTLERLTHQNGNTTIRGSVHLGAPFQTLSFSGEMDASGKYEFTYSSAAGSGHGVASRVGDYVRPKTVMLSRTQFALLDFNYLGLFVMHDQTSPAYFNGVLRINSADPDGNGGLYASGDVEGTTTPLLHGALQFSFGDIWAGALWVNVGNFLADGVCTNQGFLLLTIFRTFDPASSSNNGRWTVGPDIDCPQDGQQHWGYMKVGRT